MNSSSSHSDNNTFNRVDLLSLPSGLRLVHRLESAEVEYFGASIDAGSRDDPEGLHGLAHFVEHVIFKGTSHRKSWHIVNRMEAVGGELNAYTTKENTVVYSVCPAGNFMRGADLIADLLCNSVFPASELAKERDVVADEIAQYRDMPSEAVFDDFEDMIFAGSQLGHNILGSASELDLFTPEICVDYCHRNFTADNMVLFYSGPLAVKNVVRGIERLFSTLPQSHPARQKRIAPPQVPVFLNSCSLGNHQANTVMGLRLGSMFSPSRWTDALLCNIIGGPGMNSLLNLDLRERHGLVYAADASMALLSDVGLFTIYWGCDPEDNDRCRRMAMRIVDRIASGKLTDRFIERARRQYLGQLTVSTANRENSIMSSARAALYYGSLLPHDKLVENISSITSNDIREAAARMIETGFSSLTLV